MFFKKLIMGTLNAISKPMNGYDRFGLKYSLDHIRIMFPKILDIPITEQAEYADYVTTKDVNEDWFIENINNTVFDLSIIQSMNTTSIGNLAYIALNCKDKEARINSLILISQVKEHFKNK